MDSRTAGMVQIIATGIVTALAWFTTQESGSAAFQSFMVGMAVIAVLATLKTG